MGKDPGQSEQKMRRREKVEQALEVIENYLSPEPYASCPGNNGRHRVRLVIKPPHRVKLDRLPVEHQESVSEHPNGEKRCKPVSFRLAWHRYCLPFEPYGVRQYNLSDHANPANSETAGTARGQTAQLRRGHGWQSDGQLSDASSPAWQVRIKACRQNGRRWRSVRSSSEHGPLSLGSSPGHDFAHLSNPDAATK
jgi:hypothetical protein